MRLFGMLLAGALVMLPAFSQSQAGAQEAGWKVMRLAKPLPDGNVAYVHIINPVVPGADYTVMQNLYDMFPEERQVLYELYRGAFAANLSLAVGNMVGPPPAAPG